LPGFGVRRSGAGPHRHPDECGQTCAPARDAEDYPIGSEDWSEDTTCELAGGRGITLDGDHRLALHSMREMVDENCIAATRGI
jgi:hypothetical protein